MKPHLWSILILLVISFIGIKALFRSGWYTSHDGEHQLVRQYIFDRAIKAGHIPPRIDRQLLNGLGYPLFTFTYQLPFILGEPFRLLGLSVQDTVKIVFILTYIASGLAMYLFAQELWGKLPGFFSALLYLWAPYRFSVLFVRASLGEHVALVFVPLLLWSLNRKFLTPTRLVVGALSFAGLVLSHVMAAQIFLPLIVLFCLAKLFTSSKRKFLTHTVLVFTFGIGLSSYYLLPAVVHRSAIQGLNRHFYTDHFVSLKQLLYSPWGYGFSQLGTANDDMSFQIGLAQWLVVAVATGLWLWKARLNQASSLLAGFVLSVLMMLRLSTPIWNYLILYQHWFIIDIPWRWGALATFTAAALGGFVLSQLTGRKKFILLVLVASLAVYGNRNHLRVNEYLSYPDERLARYDGTSTSYDEYQSALAKESMVKGPDLKPIELLSGQADIQVTQSLPHKLIFRARVDAATQLQINTVYFPGWALLVNRQSQSIQSLLAEGVPRLKLEPGTYTIDLTYRQTPVMRLGNAISLLTAGLILLFMIKPKPYAQT